MPGLKKIISGGQTGVDQAALRAAMTCGLSVGGWCPPGRSCEAGVIGLEFPLIETPEERSPDAPQVPRSLRTEWNVRDADATLVLRPAGECEDPGTEWTIECARRLGKAVRSCDPFEGYIEAIAGWIEQHAVEVLHVAGPAERVAPGIGHAVVTWMTALVRRLRS